MNAARAFRAAVEARDLAALADVFSEDATLHSPAVYRPYGGRHDIGALLAVLLEILEAFRYTDEFEAADGSCVLLFEARVGNRELQGVDILRFDAEGRVTDLTVMIRPRSGLEALLGAVTERLAARAG
jgi:hypothetical protein